MIKISVIVPVYNTEKYLPKCLDSLVNQTLKDIEIIIVNDGSPDNSQKIIDDYVKKYKNIKAFEKKNGGLSDARNYGIKKASGEYIAFLDSDDYVTVDMYEKMYKKAISQHFDMVVCDLNYVYNDKVVKAYSNIKDDTTDIRKATIGLPDTGTVTRARAGWCKPLGHGIQAFSRELPSENNSRMGRVTALWVLDVSASEKRAVTANCGWYRGSWPFVPNCGRKGLFFCISPFQEEET